MGGFPSGTLAGAAAVAGRAAAVGPAAAAGGSGALRRLRCAANVREITGIATPQRFSCCRAAPWSNTLSIVEWLQTASHSTVVRVGGSSGNAAPAADGGCGEGVVAGCGGGGGCGAAGATAGGVAAAAVAGRARFRVGGVCGAATCCGTATGSGWLRAHACADVSKAQQLKHENNG